MDIVDKRYMPVDSSDDSDFASTVRQEKERIKTWILKGKGRVQGGKRLRHLGATLGPWRGLTIDNWCIDLPLFHVPETNILQMGQVI
jgi:hypothetical protein